MRSVWSHFVMVGVGSTAISVGTDSEQVVDLLRPWTIEDYDVSDIDLFDYAVALDPPHPEGKTGGPKPMPRLHRGSCVLTTSPDPQQVTAALLQCLATHDTTTPAPPGTMRIELTPLIRNGAAVLAPPRQVMPLSERRLSAQGITRLDTVSCLLDPEAMTASFDAPLGADAPHPPVPVVGLFLPISGKGPGVVQFTAGRAVGQAMGLTLDVVSDNAAWHLESLARCVERTPTDLAPGNASGWSDALDRLFNRGRDL